MAEDIDYYEVLGIPSDADESQIKSAYRERAFNSHPDRPDNKPEDVANMKDITEAYSVLSNPQLRSEYDGLRPVAHDEHPDPSDHTRIGHEESYERREMVRIFRLKIGLANAVKGSQYGDLSDIVSDLVKIRERHHVPWAPDAPVGEYKGATDEFHLRNTVGKIPQYIRDVIGGSHSENPFIDELIAQQVQPDELKLVKDAYAQVQDLLPCEDHLAQSVLKRFFEMTLTYSPEMYEKVREQSMSPRNADGTFGTSFADYMRMVEEISVDGITSSPERLKGLNWRTESRKIAEGKMTEYRDLRSYLQRVLTPRMASAERTHLDKAFDHKFFNPYIELSADQMYVVGFEMAVAARLFDGNPAKKWHQRDPGSAHLHDVMVSKRDSIEGRARGLAKKGYNNKPGMRKSYTDVMQRLSKIAGTPETAEIGKNVTETLKPLYRK